MLALAAAAGAAGGPQKGALAGFVLGLMYDLSVGTPLGSSSLAMGIGGYRRRLRARRSRSSATGGWRRCSAGSARPSARRWCRSSARSSARSRCSSRGSVSSSRSSRRVPWCSARCWCRSGGGACASSVRSGKLRRKHDGCAAMTRASRMLRRWQRSARARLGILALVATLLLGAIGARLWFLQTVQAESLQQTVDARKTKTVRLLPERGRIVDIDGRILADNERVLTVSVDWDVMRQRHRPSRAVHPPVRMARGARRRDGGALRLRALQPLQADAGQGGRQGVRRHRHQRAHRGLPGRHDRRGLAARVPVRSARRPRPRLHGRDHGRGPGALRRARLRHVRRRRARRAQRRRAGHGGGAPRQVGRGGASRSTPTTASSARSATRHRSTEWTCSCRSTSTTSSTPSACCRPSCACVEGSRSRTRRSSGSRPTAASGSSRWTRASPSGTQVAYKAPAGSVTVMDQHSGQIVAMASYPTFDNRWFDSGVDGEKFNDHLPARTSRTPTTRC